MGVIGAAQGVLGTVQAIAGSARAKKLRKQRKAYQTPEEVFKMLNASLANAQGDTISRDFAAGQIDKSFSEMLGSATRLGADPNNLSELFRQKMNNLMVVGDQFHKSNLAAFSNVTSAYDVVASNEAAEQKSKQDMLKDDILGAQQTARDGMQNISGGINTAMAGFSAAKSNSLYADRTNAMLSGLNQPAPTGVGGQLPVLADVNFRALPDASALAGGRPGLGNPMKAAIAGMSQDQIEELLTMLSGAYKRKE